MNQKTALSILKLGHTTFLTGAAGAGKSYVLREYINYLRRHGIRHAITASTGIASTHIGGTTIHAWSGIGIKQKLHAYELDALEEKQNLYKRWNDTHVLIIDEVSMLHASFIDMLDKVARHMRRNDKPFGGIQVIFTGDFFQLPPVVRVDSEYDLSRQAGMKDVFAFTSRAWKEAKPVVCYLQEQFRQDDDKLSSILDAIRKGEINDEHYELLHNASTVVHTKEYIKLYTHNENVDQINKKEFDKIDGETRTYVMITKGKANLVASLKNNCLADEVLELKVGAKVICIKNAKDQSYVNGSMGVVKSFTSDGAPVVSLQNGRTVTIVADSWKIEEDGKVRAEIQQLPIKLAWAITIHKSQGMTLDGAEIDLQRAFTGGQGYVALSRLKTLKGLYLKGFNTQALEVEEVVREVDRQLLSKSMQAEKALMKYSEKELQDLYEKFIIEKGGTIEEVDVQEINTKVEKIPSFIKTQELLKKKLSLTAIAKERNISVDTVIGHIEKIIESKGGVVLDHILPKKADTKKISKAFTELRTTKLTPVYEYFDGKYSYHDIRLVRASIQASQ